MKEGKVGFYTQLSEEQREQVKLKGNQRRSGGERERRVWFGKIIETREMKEENAVWAFLSKVTGSSLVNKNMKSGVSRGK